MDSTGIQPVMNMGNDGGVFGGNGLLGVIALFVLLGLFNGNGGLFGGGNSNTQALEASMQRGFDTQNMQANTAGILSAVNAGTAQAVATTNQVYHDTVMALNDKYSELQRDIAGLSVGQANVLANQNECCCSTKQLIMQNDYNGAMRDAATNANITAQIQGLKDMINQNTIQGLRDQVDSLRDQVNMSGVLRFPNQWSYGAGPFPPIFGGCNCNGNI